MKPRSLLAACLLALAVLLGCAGCASTLPPCANRLISYRLTQEPVTLDPQVAEDSAAVVLVEALFEGLVRLDSEGKPYPGVAESWTANADCTQFTFSLREGALWSNGEPVRAADFVYAFQRTVDPATGSATAASMDCIKNARKIRQGALPASALGVAARDAHTLVVELEYAYADFPALTATTPFMPCNQAFFEESEGQYGLEARFILGNGPFVMSSRYAWSHGESLRLSRSSTYVGASPVYPAGLQCSIGAYPTQQALSLLLEGETDAAPLSSGDLEAAEAAGCTITSFPDTTWGLCFNTASEWMQYPALRKAFVQTLDRAALLAHLPKNTEQAQDILPPQTSFLGQSYRRQAGAGFFLRQDNSALQEAASTLAGLNRDSMPSITVLCPEDTQSKRMVNEMIAVWNEKMGTYFNMEPLSEEALKKRVASGSYDVALFPIRAKGTDPLSTLSLFQSDNPENPAFLKDSAYDALLSAAESNHSADSLSRLAAAEKYLNEQCIFYPIYYESHHYAAAPGVTGVVFHGFENGIDFIRAGKE